MTRNVQEGDFVKVTETRVVEGKVNHVYGDGSFDVLPEGKQYTEAFSAPGSDDEYSTEVEFIDPPVVVFQPGDRLRYKHRDIADFEVTLADGGWLHHSSSTSQVMWCPSGKDAMKQFTSKDYEKVI